MYVCMYTYIYLSQAARSIKRRTIDIIMMLIVMIIILSLACISNVCEIRLRCYIV